MPVSLFWTVRSLPRHMLSGLHPKPTANPAEHPQGVRRIRKAAKPPTAAQWVRFGSEKQARLAKKPRRKAGIRAKQGISELERLRGVEPPYAAWEAAVLPMNYSRI